MGRKKLPLPEVQKVGVPAALGDALVLALQKVGAAFPPDIGNTLLETVARFWPYQEPVGYRARYWTLFPALLAHVAEGGGIRSFCDARGEHSRAYNQWIDEDPERRSQYDLARIESADRYAEEIVALSDTANEKTWPAVRVQVAARQWVASKLKPNHYGDKVDVTHSGKIDTSALSDEELATRLSRLMNKGSQAMLSGNVVDVEAEE